MDMITGILTSPITLTLLGLAYKYMPGLRTFVANRAIPILNIAVALAGGMLALASGSMENATPTSFAHAQGMVGEGIVNSGFFSFLGGEARGFLGALGGAVGSAAQAYLLNKITFNQWLTRPADSKR